LANSPTDEHVPQPRDGSSQYSRGDRPDKAHVATDANGLITDSVYDTACVHDSQHRDDLIQNEKLAVFGDSAYMSQERKTRYHGLARNALDFALGAIAINFTEFIDSNVTSARSLRLHNAKML